MLNSQEKGGVEEKKEESMEHEFSEEYRTAPQSLETFEDDDEQMTGIQAHLQRLTDTILGSCGGVLEAAALYIQNQTCRCVPQQPEMQQMPLQQPDYRPALSIAEELKLLAEKEGRPYPTPQRRGDIPKFLGEEAVYSFEDDNISAISQHTLEDMARSGAKAARQAYSRRIKNTAESTNPPSPIRTISYSSSSSKEHRNDTIDERLV